ncbi:MAG TPA: dCMP deaminase family protein [Dehalococcoidia bacterium]|nr:dCMP deaminase family protein [Dehalococcoidia bacterium]
MPRPDPDAYFMGIALAVRARANCTGRRVGAVIVRDRRILSSGYNGTPARMLNCEEGGCHRCAHPAAYAPGEGYDLCICVHAEQNALLAAARFGVAIEGCSLYSTLQPCFGCLKEMLQANVREVCYLQPWESRFPEQYAALVGRLGADRFRPVHVNDPDAGWALGRAGTALERALGHELLGD